ncbi:hypothetical protein BDY24DRAFT_415014 [Mrakia frigida]|uniref:uncharacterized protein n=1 Tax=Mrakia frigida TaxID=29902 RepID=UPI003FCC1B9B
MPLLILSAIMAFAGLGQLLFVAQDIVPSSTIRYDQQQLKPKSPTRTTKRVVVLAKDEDPTRPYQPNHRRYFTYTSFPACSPTSTPPRSPASSSHSSSSSTASSSTSSSSSTLPRSILKHHSPQHVVQPSPWSKRVSEGRKSQASVAMDTDAR